MLNLCKCFKLFNDKRNKQSVIYQLINSSVTNEAQNLIKDYKINIFHLFKFLLKQSQQNQQISYNNILDKLPKNFKQYFIIAYYLLPNINVFGNEIFSFPRQLLYLYQDGTTFNKNYLGYADKLQIKQYVNNLTKFKINPKFLYINVDQHPNQPYACYFYVMQYDGQIIVNVRGTVNIGDVLTDVDTYPYKLQFQNNIYYLHRGVYECAKKCIKLLKEKQLLIDGIIFTGYSLGGGIATMLQLLALTQNYQTTTYSYSPLPVMCIKAGQLIKNDVTTFIIESDFAPVSSIHALRVHLQRFINEQQNNINIFDNRQVSMHIHQKEDFYLPGRIIRLYHGKFYDIDIHDYTEFNSQYTTICHHASNTYVQEQIERIEKFE